MELGCTYKFTLQSGKTVEIIIHGTKQGASGMTEFEITVDGATDTYTDVNAALGGIYVKVERV